MARIIPRVLLGELLGAVAAAPLGTPAAVLLGAFIGGALVFVMDGVLFGWE